MYQHAAELYQQTRLNVSDSALDRATYSARQSPLPGLAVALTQQGNHREAWAKLEQNLARALLDEVANRQAWPLNEQEQRIQQTNHAALQQLDEAISKVFNMEHANEQQARLTQLKHERHKRQLASNEFARQMRTKYGIRTGDPFTLERIQDSLERESVLVYWLDMTHAPFAGPHAIHYACVVRKTGDPRWLRLLGTGENGQWTDDDESLAEEYRALVRDPRSSPSELAHKRERLYNQRVAPITDFLVQHDEQAAHWIVLPSDMMAGIPVETLTDKIGITYVPSGSVFAWIRENRAPAVTGGRLLAVGAPKLPTVDRSSLPSNGVLIMSVRPNSNAAAIGLRRGHIITRYGDKVVDSVDSLASAIADSGESKKQIPLEFWNEGFLQNANAPPGKLGVTIGSVTDSDYLTTELALKRTLRDGTGQVFGDLPGTRLEIETIAELFGDDHTLLMGDDATEKRVQELANQDRLQEFSHIHFATHGELKTVSAFHSALILTPNQDEFTRQHGVFDGRLTAMQIIRTWKLNADLVTLSACDTGLGRYASGEGYQGFGQAFLLSGARSVVLSLWKVDDAATYLLMTRFYQNLVNRADGERITKASALKNAKTWLRSLDSAQVGMLVETYDALKRDALKRGKRPRPDKPIVQLNRTFEHPHYWAGFVLIGDHK